MMNESGVSLKGLAEEEESATRSGCDGEREAGRTLAMESKRET